jgi:exopolysaccharide production protein ExoZ
MLVHNGGYSLYVPDLGASGVDLFFVISGFIMIYTNLTAFCQPNASTSFIRRRVIRIVPMYLLCTTGVVILLAFAPRLFSSVEFTWTYVVSSYLFLLSENSAGQVGTVIQTGWSLCFEVYFYLLFAIFLNLPRKYFLIASGAVFASGIILGNVSGKIPPWATVATDPILFEFYLGAAIAFLFVKGFAPSRTVAISAIILGIATLFVTRNINLGIWTHLICRGFPSGAILLGAISLERVRIRVPKLFVALGDSSYSLYLTHPFILPALGKLWLALHLSERTSPVVLGLIGFSCSLSVGHAVYLLIEKPITTWLSQTWSAYKPLSAI